MTNDVESGLPQLTRAHMPGDYAISLAQYTRGGTDRFLAEGRDDMPEQSMRGFEDQYRNIIDYIVRITHRIWEEKDIGYIYDTYAHNSRVYDDYGCSTGETRSWPTPPTRSTPSRTSAWWRTRSSGRVTRTWGSTLRTAPSSRATTRATAAMGRPPASGFRSGASPTACRARTRFSWSTCSTTPRRCCARWALICADVARQMAESGGAALPDDYTAGEPARQRGQAKPSYPAVPKASGELDVEDFIRSLYQCVWNRRMLGTLQGRYADNLVFNGPTDRAFSGLGPYQAFRLVAAGAIPGSGPGLWMRCTGWATLPTATSYQRAGTRTARIGAMACSGRPRGVKRAFGALPSTRIEDGRVTEEWMLFNELDVMMQLLGASPEESRPVAEESGSE